MPSAAGHLTFFPAGPPPQNVSTINFSAGQVRANNAILVLSDDGQLGVLPFVVGDGQVHLIVDVNGYFD